MWKKTWYVKKAHHKLTQGKSIVTRVVLCLSAAFHEHRDVLLHMQFKKEKEKKKHLQQHFQQYGRIHVCNNNLTTQFLHDKSNLCIYLLPTSRLKKKQVRETSPTYCGFLFLFCCGSFFLICLFRFVFVFSTRQISASDRNKLLISVTKQHQ